MIERPIFLVGAERSGTTLLRLMLDHHPEIAFHFEFELAVERIGADGAWPDLEAYTRWLETDRIWRESGFSVDRSLDYPRLVDSFLVQKRDRDRKRLVGATVHRHFDRLLEIWPNARFLHLVRDGRDVARSVVGMGWAGNPWHGASRWLQAEATWDRLQVALPPERWVEVRYEQLIADPERALRRLCDFVGVPFDPAMFDYARTSTYDLPEAGLVGQWRSKLAPREVRLVESCIGPVLLDRGYALSGLEPLRPGGLARAWLRLDSRIRLALFRARRYGPRLFAADLLSRRLGLDAWQRRVALRRDEVDSAYRK